MAGSQMDRTPYRYFLLKSYAPARVSEESRPKRTIVLHPLTVKSRHAISWNDKTRTRQNSPRSLPCYAEKCSYSTERNEIDAFRRTSAKRPCELSHAHPGLLAGHQWIRSEAGRRDAVGQPEWRSAAAGR